MANSIYFHFTRLIKINFQKEPSFIYIVTEKILDNQNIWEQFWKYRLMPIISVSQTQKRIKFWWVRTKKIMNNFNLDSMATWLHGDTHSTIMPLVLLKSHMWRINTERDNHTYSHYSHSLPWANKITFNAWVLNWNNFTWFFSRLLPIKHTYRAYLAQ